MDQFGRASVTEHLVDRHVDMEPNVRARYEALSPRQRARLAAILGPDLARGWIPKKGDIIAAIETVLAQDDQPAS